MSNTVLSFQKWIQGEKPKVVTQNALQKKYTNYLKNTQTQTLCADYVNTEAVKQEYLDLIKSIAINYTTPEEKRYLIGIDYNNIDSVRTVIPFFVKKLKEVLLQTSKERDKAKFNTIRYNLKGSKFGLETFIINDIQQFLANSDLRTKYPDAPSPQFFIENYNFIYTELYDFYQHYNDIDNVVPIESYVSVLDTERFQYFFTNVVANNPLLFLNIRSVIYNQANTIKYTLLTSSGKQLLTRKSQSITVAYNTNNLTNLESKYFLYGVKTEANHIANLTKQVISKYIAQNNSYLTSLSSANLVTNADLQSNNTNKYFSSIAAIPSVSNLQSKKETGGFYLPHLLAKNYFLSKNFQPVLNISLSGGYIVPDQKYLIPGRGQTLRNQPTPYTQYETYDWAIEANTYQGKWGIPTNSKKYPKFYGYESKEETYNKAQQGINTSSDNFEFFGGKRSDIWTNQDVYFIAELDKYPIEERVQTLNLTSDNIYIWQTDIYGNNFAVYKNDLLQREVTVPVNNFNDTTNIWNTFLEQQVPGIDDPNVFIVNLGLGKDKSQAMFNYRSNNSDTKFNPITQVLPNNKTIYGKWVQTYGHIRLRTVNSAVVTSLSSAMADVFNKYSGSVLSEIYENVFRFFIIKDYIIVETPNYIVFEQYQYNQESNTFTSILPASIILNK